MKITRHYGIVIALASVKLILPFILQSNIYEPHRDEFLYLAEGNHLAWGYMEVPPLLSVFAWLTNLFGDGMFWIKFWPSLFGALTYVVVANIVLSLGGRSFALFLSFLPFILGVFFAYSFSFSAKFPGSIFLDNASLQHHPLHSNRKSSMVVCFWHQRGFRNVEQIFGCFFHR